MFVDVSFEFRILPKVNQIQSSPSIEHLLTNSVLSKDTSDVGLLAGTSVAPIKLEMGGTFRILHANRSFNIQGELP